MLVLVVVVVVVEDLASSDKFIVFIEVADLDTSEMFKSSGVEDLA